MIESTRPARATPESEQNPPEDRTMGWQPWRPGIDRWWMGRQWGEAYRASDGVSVQRPT